MNIVLLSPSFPPNYYNFAVALRRSGANVLGLGDTPYEQLHPELRAALTEYYRVDDLHQYDALVRGCGYFTYRYGHLDRIESHNEYWLETDARLRTDFNVLGPDVEDIAWVKRKSKMKHVFANAGVDVARGQIVRTLPGAERFVAEVGYPVIAKPDIGVGAVATFKINNDAELADFIEHKPPVDYMMESFVYGDLYSFDGLVDQNGHVVFYTSHFFNQGIMETVNDDLEIYYYSLREIPKDLVTVGMHAVNAFKLRERFFHIEFFRLDDDSWVVLEVNMRPPGGLTMDMFNYANDINLYQAWANVVVHNEFRAEYSRPYHCAYVGRKRNLSHKLSHEEVLRAYADLVVYHGPMSDVLSPALGNYAYLVRSPDLATLQDAIDGIQAR